MTVPLFHVDAFTDKPFGGNPAAVCLLAEKRADEWMQAVAAEMNLSETAFLVKNPDGFDLRWFTGSLAPGEVMMVVAHLYDLRAARAVGLKVAFVPRPSEVDVTADPDFDVVATDFVDLARQLAA